MSNDVKPNTDRLVRWVNSGLVVALGVSLAQLSWRLAPDRFQSAPVFDPVAKGESSRSSPTLEQVAALHLFGSASEAPAKAAPVKIPETRLNLVLKGIFAVDDPNDGGAIIADGRGQEGFYRVGARIPGGAVLSRISADHVVLSRNGNLETLRLPSDSDSGVDVAYSRAQPSVTEHAVHLPELVDYRTSILENPAKALELISLQPVAEAGQVKGYRISPGKDRALFQRLGLRNGDVVTALNGVVLDQSLPLSEVSRQLASAPQLLLTLERNGEIHNLTINID